MVKEIPLRQGRMALVDDEDYEWLIKFRWTVMRSRPAKNTHIAMVNGRQKTLTVYMARLIMNPPDGLEVKHKNNDFFDCQKNNLLLASHSQIMATKWRTHVREKTSKYRGVSWSERNKGWMARIEKNRKSVYLGTWKDEDNAARAYNVSAYKLFGEFADLNNVGGWRFGEFDIKAEIDNFQQKP